MRYSNPSHPKKITRTACLALHSALEIAHEKERSKEEVCDTTKEKEEEKYEVVKYEKEKEEEKRNGRDKEKRREREKGKERDKEKEKVKIKDKDKERDKGRNDELMIDNIRDVNNVIGSHAHTRSGSTSISASTGASLARVVWDRRAAAVSNTTSKPRLEQVTNNSTLSFPI